MNWCPSAECFTLIKPARARLAQALLLAIAAAGCASQTNGTQPLEMMSRDGNFVSRGAIWSEFPRTTRILIDIDRRMYAGNSEPTAANDTYGLARIYGSNRYAPPAATTLERRNYYKAILSSTDNHVLRCDFTQEDGAPRNGICVDDFQRIYDVVSSR